MNKEKISYSYLAKKVGDAILCNNINQTGQNFFLNEQDEDVEVYQSFVISDDGARELINHTDEIVGYNSTLEVFVWNITHFGTSWDGVHTDYDENAEHITHDELIDLVKNF